MSLQQSQNNKKNIPEWSHPDYPTLKTGLIGKAACEGQVVEYPQVVRQDIDTPIIGQKYGNISFNFFEKPLMFQGKPIYGFFKLRGNHESAEVSRTDSYRIVRDLDSKFQVRIAPVGCWVPLTESDAVVKELYDVRESDKEIHLRDEATKKKEADSRRIQKEITEAQEQLEKGGDIYDDEENIRFYTMKRVTEMRLDESYQIQLIKLEELKKKRDEQRIIVKKLEKMYPSYSDEWLNVYNDERKKTSLPKFIPGETQFVDYNRVTLDELLEKYPHLKDKQNQESNSEKITNRNSSFPFGSENTETNIVMSDDFYDKSIKSKSKTKK